MYIDLNIIYLIAAVLGCIALGYLIVVLRNFNKVLKDAGELLTENKQSIHDSCKKMPKVVEKCDKICDNVKDVTEVVTDLTADFIVKTENVKSNMEVVSEIFSIVRNVFGK